MSAAKIGIRASGRGQARLLSELQAAQIPVFRFRQNKDGQFRFYVPQKDLQKTFAILDGMCYTYTADRFSDRKRLCRAVLCRTAFFAMVAILSACTAFARNYVWRVEIVGNDTVPDKVIENVLSAKNIAVGKPLSAFDSDEIGAAVRGLDGIAMASAERIGTTVRVEVFENAPAVPPVAYSDTDILSRFDATVTRVVTREGTALVHAGQNVFAGTPLIGAYRTVTEGEDPVKCRASGTVYGTVTHTESVTVATEWYESVPVSTREYTRLSVFGLHIGKRPASGAGVQIVESEEKFSAFLPVTVTHARVTVTEMRKRTESVQTLAARAEEEVAARFISSVASTGFTTRSSLRDLGGGLYLVNVFVTAEAVIGGV